MNCALSYLKIVGSRSETVRQATAREGTSPLRRQLFSLRNRRHPEDVQHSRDEAIVTDDACRLHHPGHAVAVFQRIEDLSV
jgi:hypothetical protein